MKANKTMLPVLTGLPLTRLLTGLLFTGLLLLAGPLFTVRSLWAQSAEKDISWYITHCPFPMTTPVVPQFPAHDFLLTDYGGIPDGHTLNTLAFQQAIEACSAAGLPQMPVSKISFDSLEIHSTKGLVATQAKDIELHAVQWIVQEEPAVQADKTAEIRVH